LVLMPIGVIIITDFWILPKFGMKSNLAELTGISTNWAALITWIGTSIFCLVLIFKADIEIFFVGIPGIIMASVLYTICSKIYQSRITFGGDQSLETDLDERLVEVGSSEK